MRFALKALAFAVPLACLVGGCVQSQMTPETVTQAALMPDSAAKTILARYGLPRNWDYVQFAQSLGAVIYNRSDNKLGLQVGGGPGGFCFPNIDPDTAQNIYTALVALHTRAPYYVAVVDAAPCAGNGLALTVQPVLGDNRFFTPPPPPPPPPAVPVTDRMTGRWSGSYYCPQGLTMVTIEVWKGTSGNLVGRFSFLPPIRSQSGSWLMNVFDSGRKIDLVPTEWERQPPGWVTVGATLSFVNRTTLHGRMNHQLCGAIDLSKQS